MGEERPPGKDIKQNGSISDLWVTSHLEQTLPSPPAHPGRQCWKPILSDLGNHPSPGARAGRKGAIKGEREKWGFLWNEHIWKQVRKGAGSFSHKTIWQLCVSLGEGLWKLWGGRCTPGSCPWRFPHACNELQEEIIFGARCLFLYVWVQFGTEDFALACRGHNSQLCCKAQRLHWFQLDGHTGITITIPGIYQMLTPARYFPCINSQHPTVDPET